MSNFPDRNARYCHVPRWRRFTTIAPRLRRPFCNCSRTTHIPRARRFTLGCDWVLSMNASIRSFSLPILNTHCRSIRCLPLIRLRRHRRVLRAPQHRWSGRLLTADWYPLATMAPAFVSTTNNPVTRFTSHRLSWLRDWSPMGSMSSLLPTGGTSAPSCGSQMVGQPCSARTGRRRCIGGAVRNTPSRGWCLAVHSRRSLISVAMRPRPTRDGRGRDCRQSRSGRLPRAWLSRLTPMQCVCIRSRRTALSKDCSSLTMPVGSGPAAPMCRTPDSVQLRVPLVNTMASS